MTSFRRFMRDLPLASKIAAFASLLVVLIVLTLTLLTIQRERENFNRELEAQATLLVGVVSGRLEDPLYKLEGDEIQEVASEIRAYPELTLFKAYDEGGTLYVDSRRPDKYSPQDPDPLRSELLHLPPGKTDLHWGQGELIAVQGVWIGSQQVGTVEMGFSTAPLDDRIRRLTAGSITLAAGALAVGILLATLAARQLTNPISELTRTANKMAAGDLSTRIRRGGRDEIGQLGSAFNDMAAAIEKRETDLRNLASGLEQAVKDRTRELEQQNQYLAALRDVTLGLNENLDVDSLLEAITVRAAALANTEHAFVYVVDPERGEMQLRVAKGLYHKRLGVWTKANQGLSGRVMASGQIMIEDDYRQFEDRQPGYDWLRTSIYMPLRSESTILGVIGLGYDKVVPVNPNHVDILKQFAQLASLALKNAQLYSAAQQEISEEEERRQAYLASPPGQAESLAASMLKNPAQALTILHDLAGNADQGSNAAILPELPGVFDLAGQALLARLAEGYHFILRSRSEPELLAIGLRHLRLGLDMDGAKSLQHADEAARLYEICQQAMDAESIHAITDLLPFLQALPAKKDVHSPFTGLANTLKALLPVVESLHAYERVDTSEDRRTYLTSAVEGLSHADRLAHALHTAERPMVRRIVENWLGIVTGSISDLQTRARLSCTLITRHGWEADLVTLALHVRNEGHGLALNLRVSLAECPDYSLFDEPVVVDRLASGEETQVELRVKPLLSPQSDQFRARFVILYDDPRGPGQMEHFADIVHLMSPGEAFQFIPNPYVVGTPLEAGSPLFFGREDVFNFIGENLNAAHRNNLVLIGQRRTGKSSLLKQLPLRLDESYVPVYLDGQSVALDPGLAAFFLNLATEISFALQERDFRVSSPSMEEFAERPAHTFEHVYLRRVRAAIGDRHLVLLLDEFEELESAAKRGILDTSVFGFLRHLVQHEPGLSVIFSGTHRMEELATDYWSVLFNISLYRHVGFLERDQAIRLIQEPVAAYGMRYDDLALDKIWRVTAGHPYFLQLLCHSVVNQHNRSGRSYVTVSDINAALDEILASGEAHFVYLWNESSLAERQVLTVLSRTMSLSGHVTPAQVEDYLVARGISLERRIVADTLHHLTLRDILVMQPDSQALGVASTYGWRLGLLSLWIEKYKSLSLVQEEAQR